MRVLTAPILALSLLAAHPAAASPPPAPAAWDLDAAKQAMEVVDAFHRALDSGDATAAAALLSEDLVVYEGGHVERSRAEYVQGHLPADIAFSRQVKSEITASNVRATGDIAIVTQESRTQGTYNGKPVDSFGVGTLVLRRYPEGWRITHIHWSSRKAPAPAG